MSFQDARIIDSIKRHIMAMPLIISTISLLYPTVYCIYYTFVHISFSHSIYCFVHIIRHLFNSWHGATELLLLRHLMVTPVEVGEHSTIRISITLWVPYLTTTMCVEITMQYLITTIIRDHPGKQLARGHQRFVHVNDRIILCCNSNHWYINATLQCRESRFQ